MPVIKIPVNSNTISDGVATAVCTTGVWAGALYVRIRFFEMNGARQPHPLIIRQ